MIFQILSRNGAKFKTKYAAIYFQFKKKIKILTHLVSEKREQILKFFKLKKDKIFMNYSCLFAGEDFFGKAITLKGFIHLFL